MVQPSSPMIWIVSDTQHSVKMGLSSGHDQSGANSIRVSPRFFVSGISAYHFSNSVELLN